MIEKWEAGLRRMAIFYNKVNKEVPFDKRQYFTVVWLHWIFLLMEMPFIVEQLYSIKLYIH